MPPDILGAVVGPDGVGAAGEGKTGVAGAAGSVSVGVSGNSTALGDTGGAVGFGEVLSPPLAGWFVLFVFWFEGRVS